VTGLITFTGKTANGAAVVARKPSAVSAGRNGVNPNLI